LGSVEMKGKTVHQFEHAKQDNDVEDVIKSGVKECIPARHPLYNPMDFSVQYRENHRLDDVASVLEKGIKETWGYEKQPQKRIDEVIMNGQKD